MPVTEYVTLVDADDNAIGAEEKLIAHQRALRHRAFSVFIHRPDNPAEILIHQRHPDKYHCGGLWTNTCCGHPRPEEATIAAGERRLFEEMGIKANLTEIGVFEYISKFDNGLTEHEIDHVLTGPLTQAHFDINPEELIDYRWINAHELEQASHQAPEHYTPWLAQALSLYLKHI